MERLAPRALVAGIGNIFLGDDGFGVEVARRLAACNLGPGVDVADIGIRGVHLAYTLLDGEYEVAILVDATHRDGPPGTIYVLEPDPDGADTPVTVDAHEMTPESVLAAVRRLGGAMGRIFVVGCEPASVEEGIGLSDAVANAVEDGVRVVQRLLDQTRATPEAA